MLSLTLSRRDLFNHYPYEKRHLNGIAFKRKTSLMLCQKRVIIILSKGVVFPSIHECKRMSFLPRMLLAPTFSIKGNENKFSAVLTKGLNECAERTHLKFMSRHSQQVMSPHESQKFFLLYLFQQTYSDFFTFFSGLTWLRNCPHILYA